MRDNGNAPREMNAIVDYTHGFAAGKGSTSLSLRSLRAKKGGDGWVASKNPTVFPVSNCTHVTPRDEVLAGNILVAHFDKVAVTKEERTKVTTLNLRGWHKADVPAVERLADLLADAAIEKAKEKKLQAKKDSAHPIGGDVRRSEARVHSGARRARPPSAVSAAVREAERRRQPRLTTADRLRAASERELKPAVVKPFRPLAGGSDVKARASSATALVGTGARRSNKFAMMSAVTQGLIGRPPDADKPLRQTKSERMRSRDRQSQIIEASQVAPALLAKKPLTISPRSALLERQPAFKDRDALPPAAKRRRTGIGSSQASAGVQSQMEPSESKGDKEIISQGATKKSPSVAQALSVRPVLDRGAAVRTTRSRGSQSGSDGEGGGILNLGNTCYLGSALQALLCDQAFVKDVETGLRRFGTCSGAGKNEAPFAKALVNLIGSRKSDNGAQLNPQLVREALSTHFSEFGTTAQQDVQEFITRCFFVLERELGQIAIARCPVSRNFSIVVENVLSCNKCFHRLEPRKELFRDLSLDIPIVQEPSEEDADMAAALDEASADLAVAESQNVVDVEAEEVLRRKVPVKKAKEAAQAPALEGLLRNYFLAQSVDLNCEVSTCDGKSAKKESAVVLAPRILVLHLKRFRVESNASGRYSLTKVNDLVQIPQFIDINDVLGSQPSGPSLFDLSTSIAKKSELPQGVNPVARPRKEQVLSVPGRSRVNPPSPEAAPVVDELFDVDVDLGCTSADVEKNSTQSPSEEMCIGPPLGTFGEKITQVQSPKEPRTPVLARCKGKGHHQHDSAQVVSLVSPSPKRVSSGDRPACAPRRLFSVFGEDGLDESGARKTRNDGLRRVTVSGMEQNIIAEEVDIDGFEPTQAPKVLPPECEHERISVAKLARQCDVPEAKARQALRETNFDYTRASGILLDADCATQLASHAGLPSQHDSRTKLASEPSLVETGRSPGLGSKPSQEKGQEVDSVLALLERNLGAESGLLSQTRYELQAIVRHHSAVAEYGHYVCDILQPDGSWVVYNDSDARPCGSRPFEREDRMREGYMFFYKLT